MFRNSWNLAAASFAVALCSTPLGAQPVIEECSTPGLVISSTLPVTSDTIAVPNNVIIGDTQIVMDITHTFLGDLDVDIQSPQFTSVRLHDQGGGSFDNILLVWTDGGIPNGPPYTCNCDMQPSGPGSLADFTDEVCAGDWILTVTDNLAGDQGTLNNWCVRIIEGCQLSPPAGLTCQAAGNAVSLSWTNNDTYDSIDVLRNGTLIATLIGNDTTHTDSNVAPGVHVYEVFGFSNSLGCGSISNDCSVALGITDLVWAHPDQDSGKDSDT